MVEEKEPRSEKALRDSVGNPNNQGELSLVVAVCDRRGSVSTFLKNSFLTSLAVLWFPV